MFTIADVVVCSMVCSICFHLNTTRSAQLQRCVTAMQSICELIVQSAYVENNADYAQMVVHLLDNVALRFGDTADAIQASSVSATLQQRLAPYQREADNDLIRMCAKAEHLLRFDTAAASEQNLQESAMSQTLAEVLKALQKVLRAPSVPAMLHFFKETAVRFDRQDVEHTASVMHSISEQTKEVLNAAREVQPKVTLSNLFQFLNVVAKLNGTASGSVQYLSKLSSNLILLEQQLLHNALPATSDAAEILQQQTASLRQMQQTFSCCFAMTASTKVSTAFPT